MKNFRDYLSESEEAADNPVVGDTFAINIREECLIESVVVESRRDGVVIAADERTMQLLESYGYSFEQTCMECGGSDCGCGQAADEYRDETDVDQDPGEYDQEGDMAKDELMTMIRSARRLIGMLDTDDNMPEWTQKKITKATDYVDTAADYISSKKERGVMEQGAALPDIRGLGPDAQALILKLRRDVEDKRLQPTPQAVLAAARELAGDLEFAPLLLVQQVLGNAKGIAEGDSKPNPVARATLHRIMMSHPGMLAQHGPERVMQAVDDVADLVGDVDEIGTSDISGWVNMVQEILDSLDQGVAEGHADQQRKIFKKNGQPVGEVGIDRESSPGVGQYYMKHYASGKDLSGFDSFEEAVQELRHLTKQGVAEGSLNEAATMASVSKLLRHIERHNPTWFDDYGMGEVEDTVVDMAKQGTFSGMTVVDAAALVGQELESLYGANGMNEAEYQGRKVPLGKPMRGDVAKSKVYVRDPKTGNIKKVNFGDPNMKIKKSNPARRKSFRARHNCDNPGPRTKARYWSCRAW